MHGKNQYALFAATEDNIFRDIFKAYHDLIWPNNVLQQKPDLICGRMRSLALPSTKSVWYDPRICPCSQCKVAKKTLSENFQKLDNRYKIGASQDLTELLFDLSSQLSDSWPSWKHYQILKLFYQELNIHCGNIKTALAYDNIDKNILKSLLEETERLTVLFSEILICFPSNLTSIFYI